MFFFEKKNQKTFGCSRRLSGQRLATQQPWFAKLFLLLFFKKEVLAFLLGRGR